MRRVADALLAWRYPLLGLVAVAVYARGLWLLHGDAGGDWFLFTLGASYLETSHALHVFAVLPLLQTGPLSVLLSIPLSRLGPNDGWYVTSALLFCLAIGLVRICESAAERGGLVSPRQLRAAVLIGGSLLVVAWAGPGEYTGHPDDVFALVAIGAAVWAATTRRWVVAALAVGMATAFKPWGLYFLPLAALVPGRRGRGLVVALAVGFVPWVPFIIGDSRTLQVAHFHFVKVGTGSTLRALGVGVGSHPSWVRPVQLATTWALGATAVLRGRWQSVPWLVTAARINLEVRWFPYYGAGAVLGALLVDMTRPTRIPGSRTALVWLLLYAVPPAVTHFTGGNAADVLVIAARLSVLALALVAAFGRPAEPTQAGAGTEGRPALKAG